MATASFDPQAYKQTTREQWQRAAEPWHRWAPTLEDWLGEATELMLDLAGFGAGARVLDVAAGAGGQTIRAARRVGQEGAVLATDLSPAILSFVEQTAREAGLTNVHIREMDGEALEVEAGSYDAAICRLGLIYMPDRLAALRGIHRALRPGGRIATINYSPAERNEFFSIPASIIRRRVGLPAPAPGQPGPFSLATEEATEVAYREAGFSEVDVRRLEAPLRLSSVAECVRFEQESFGALHQMLSGLEESEREEVWAEIESELSRFEEPGGFNGPCELLVSAATK